MRCRTIVCQLIRRQISSAVVALTTLVAASPAAAEDGAKTPWTIDDVAAQESINAFSLNADGTAAIWVRHTPDREKDESVSTLMLTDFGSEPPRELTVRKSGVSAPAFRPDGRAVSFLSEASKDDGSKDAKKEKGGPQIWLLDLRGGEARQLTDIPHGVGSYRWIDNETILLTTRERSSRAELVAEEDKDDTLVVEDVGRFRDEGRNLFRFEVKDQKLTRLAAGLGGVQMMEVSPDGHYVAALHDQSPSYEAEADVPPRCLIHDLEKSTHVEVLAEQKNKPRQIHWRPDSKGLLLVVPHSTVDGEAMGAIQIVLEVSAPDWQVRQVELGWERGLFHSLIPTEDGFLATLADGVRPLLALLRREVGGYVRDQVTAAGTGAVFACDKARRGSRVLYVQGSASDPDHLMTARLVGSKFEDAREVYRPNKGFSDKLLARTRIIRFAGAGGEMVEGVVHEPHDFKPGQKHPLVVMTHGGPHGADYDRFYENWAHSPNLYAQRGAFVLSVNYHGSSDYGLAFGESIKGRYYELEIQDILAGVQALVDEGVVDRERMGLVGWSNGAILSIACLTLADRYAPQYDFQFQACAPGAADVNWSSDYGNCEFGPVFDDFYLGGPPWKLPDLYHQKSPLFHVERVHTPTIIFFGTKDRAVPTEQGWQWYRALHMIKQTPVRFVLFPDQPHGLRKISHKRRKLSEELAWFDEHLFANAAPGDQLVKAGSPLAVALDKRQFAAADGAYGVRAAGKLVPECVDVEGLTVGRFEVTRAQWNAFRPEVDVPAGLENHPQTGIDLDAAQQYVKWLGEATGEPWRLLTATEFERLAKLAGPRENTLDWWAGYAPNPDEAAALSERLQSLPPETILLEVGSRPPHVDKHGAEQPLIFDVGGNAAELVVNEDGTAKTAGGCAVLSTDKRVAEISPPAEFIGLRVAKGMPKAEQGAKDEQPRAADESAN